MFYGIEVEAVVSYLSGLATRLAMLVFIGNILIFLFNFRFAFRSNFRLHLYFQVKFSETWGLWG